jgi:hypothetical protein
VAYHSSLSKKAGEPTSEGSIREVTLVDTSNPLWAAMVFLAVLAYPESFIRRDRAILAMKALMYRAARSFDRPIGCDSSDTFASMPVQQQRGTLRRLDGRLKKRLKAGIVASLLLIGLRKPGRVVRIAPLDQQRTRQALIANGASYTQAARLTMKRRTFPGKPYSLNDFARHYAGGAARFKTDVWRPEIVHLTLAFHSLAVTWPDSRGFGVARLLANPDWSVQALKSADLHAEMLPRTANLPKALSRLRGARLIRLIPSTETTSEISEPDTRVV